ncbi:MAG: Uncharacterised protein [Bacteroidota bacterium]|nr:MAG: Uncharacterised protein [Bacteroidota bacterium]
MSSVLLVVPKIHVSPSFKSFVIGNEPLYPIIESPAGISSISTRVLSSVARIETKFSPEDELPFRLYPTAPIKFAGLYRVPKAAFPLLT